MPRQQVFKLHWLIRLFWWLDEEMVFNSKRRGTGCGDVFYSLLRLIGFKTLVAAVHFFSIFLWVPNNNRGYQIQETHHCKPVNYPKKKFSPMGPQRCKMKNQHV
jgi:hypothetical protein